MKRGLFIFLSIVFAIAGGDNLRAQGGFCDDIEPFCAGDEKLVFENSNAFDGGVTNGQMGPDYGCLLTQPYPAWFFLQIEESGNLNFTISQFQNENGTGAQLDVDYVVWGPFENADDYCNNASLNEENIIACSYSEAARENLSITNAQAGNLYVVVITNFSRSRGYISLQQTNPNQAGAGATDCSILESTLGEDRIICEENSVILDGTTEDATNYEWYIYDEVNDSYNVLPGETNPTLEVSVTGNYRVVVSNSGDGSTDEDDVTVSFYDKPVASLPKDFVACAMEEETVNLTQASAEILDENTSGENYQVFYYASEEAAEEDRAITNPQTYDWSNNTEVFANVVGQESGCKSETIAFEITTTTFNDPGIEAITPACLDEQGNLLQNINIGSDVGEEYSYEWYEGNNVVSTNPVLTFNNTPSSRDFRLVLTDTTTGCSRAYETTIEYFSAPAGVLFEIEGSDFTGGYRVNAEAVPGPGSDTGYEYRMDNGSWQSGAVFKNVQPGSHVVYAREINGCGIKASESFDLVGYKRFFTPNGDGYNDTWGLIFADEMEVRALYIFDRYGKLLKQISPYGPGWDGTLNGTNAPARDYWFKLEYLDETTGIFREFSGHFSLVR
ncbi:T9SS type B sorting domain-containing protein [Autumnicola musiva]|uniref:T9SS type B sorting domain-containing protein n=1 Tax=Autumnicola musiva TaxID=3075589 RepID=A0ABU3D2J0_9FLAO|nr:T9SS type B sorting domain-containing protein [Zunongwangia sp. F117]MDT0675751.1 T9SS type B sorting domain-containing protein [Zunongwangia sp. F117]